MMLKYWRERDSENFSRISKKNKEVLISVSVSVVYVCLLSPNKKQCRGWKNVEMKFPSLTWTQRALNELCFLLAHFMYHCFIFPFSSFILFFFFFFCVTFTCYIPFVSAERSLKMSTNWISTEGEGKKKIYYVWK